MKKVLLVFENNQFPEGAFQWLTQLNSLSPLLLIGVFLPQNQDSGLWNYTDAIGLPMLSEPVRMSTDETETQIKLFEQKCMAAQINFRIHAEFYDFTLQELVHESLFADLLVVGTETFTTATSALKPGLHLHDSLHQVKCPVMLIPNSYKPIENILLAYDGADDSVYAIRQFGQLLPECCGLPTTLVYAHEDTEKDFPDKIILEEMAARHFPQLSLTRLYLNPLTEFEAWAETQPPSLLVSGAFGRSAISQLFRKSFVSPVIKAGKLPLFLAHY
jgi:hypothetical protein